jgi:hypothetical protein
MTASCWWLIQPAKDATRICHGCKRRTYADRRLAAEYSTAIRGVPRWTILPRILFDRISGRHARTD